MNLSLSTGLDDFYRLLAQTDLQRSVCNELLKEPRDQDRFAELSVRTIADFVDVLHAGIRRKSNRVAHLAFALSSDQTGPKYFWRTFLTAASIKYSAKTPEGNLYASSLAFIRDRCADVEVDLFVLFLVESNGLNPMWRSQLDQLRTDLASISLRLQTVIVTEQERLRSLQKGTGTPGLRLAGIRTARDVRLFVTKILQPGGAASDGASWPGPGIGQRWSEHDAVVLAHRIWAVQRGMPMAKEGGCSPRALYSMLQDLRRHRLGPGHLSGDVLETMLSQHQCFGCLRGPTPDQGHYEEA